MNCGEDHPANYKGYSYYQKIKSNIQSKQTRSTTIKQTEEHNTHKPHYKRENHYTHTYKSKVTNQMTEAETTETPLTDTIINTLITFVKPIIEKIKQYITSMLSSLISNYDK